ncbi:MAG: 4Fe-4S ferredoxin [Syntrophobacteria bacterium]
MTNGVPMSEKVKARVKELLDSGKIRGFLGLKNMNGHIGPHLFCDSNDLDDLVTGDRERPGDSRYPLNKQLINFARCYPEETFGVLVRGCDERGVKTLFTWNQLDPEKVVPVGIACPQELAEGCECLQPYPDEFVDGEKAEGCSFASVAQVDGFDLAGRLEHWLAEFAKCVKCYGCRNICPMCFCKECTLESKDLIHTGDIPPENPIFHLTRAVHMAGRCIDCGLCNEACPADIPLRTLYKKVADIIDQEFHYRPGYAAAGEKPPLNILGGAPEH